MLPGWLIRIARPFQVESDAQGLLATTIICIHDYSHTILAGRTIKKISASNFPRLFPSILLLISLALWTSCGRLGSERLNVLLVSFDTTRADQP